MPAGWSREGVWRVVVVRYDAPVPSSLLGHRDMQTTIDTYLEPVAGLSAEVFLNGDIDAEVSELLASVVASSDQVLDVPVGLR